MSTHSSARNLFPPLDNPKLTIRRRSRTDPTLLNDFEMAAERTGDLPVPDLRAMEELCQPSLNGQGEPIAPIAIQATNFGLKNDMIQQSIKVNGVTDDALYLYLFPHSLTHHDTAWFDHLSRNSINTFEQMAKMFLGGTFMKRHLEECYDLIENMTAHHNDWDTSAQRTTVGQTQNVYAAGAYQERETEATKDTVHPTNKGSTKDIQPSVIQTESLILNFEPVVAPIIEPVVAPVSALKPNQRLLIPYPSRFQDQKLRNKANEQREKFFQMFKDLNFNISFADALILMPKFVPTIKTLLTKKDKLSELARTTLNEHCSTVLLKKLPEKLGDPDKFFMLCDFSKMVECLALADLDGSINLMPLSVWNKLLLPNLSPICMTLELTNRLIFRSVGVAKDVFVKVGTFHFPADFVVVDFDADPRVPLILRRYFLKTGRALNDLFEGELTLRVGKEAITFNLDQTSRHSANYNDMTENRIEVIDMACEEYSDFLLEEVDDFLALEDDPTSPEVDQSYVDTEGDILLLEAFLNDDPSLPLKDM
nr:reverse transcriptase domain-containing protein [Tanacetum cinerariifolium]